MSFGKKRRKKKEQITKMNVTHRQIVRNSLINLTDLLLEEVTKALEDEKNRKKRIWTRDWILRRDTRGASALLLKELAEEDVKEYKTTMRMTPEMFEDLLKKVGPKIKKKDTTMRMALPPRIKLEITLNFLATGDSYQSLQNHYRVPKCTISRFIPEVCDAIYESLCEYIKATTAGSTDGVSGGDCEGEEPEDPSSSSVLADGVNEALENLDLESKAPEDELSAFRQQWQRELESTPTPQPKVHPEPKAKTETLVEPQSEEDLAKLLFMRAVELERGGELYEAIQHYKRAMAILPDVESRLYESSELRDTPDLESEPEELPTVNNNQSDDDEEEEWIEGEDLMTRLQRILAKKECLCEPELPTKGAHLSWLPCEVVLLILRWVVSSELDARSLERVAASCRGLYVLARAPDLYRELCVRTWGIECGTPRAFGFSSWRDMYISRPRLLLHGCYISKTTYLRHGENSFQDTFYRPWYLVSYYRYLRFFPEGRVLMWTTAEEPAACVAQLRTRPAKAALGIMAGHYRLMADKVVIVIKKSNTEKKQSQTSNTRFRSRRRDQPEQHEQIFHVELELRDVKQRRNFQLAWRGYSICTRRDQWTQFDITPAKFPPFAFSGVKSYTAEATAPLC